MMGERRVTQEALFYFSLERHVPNDHLLRKIDRFVDLSEVRAHLEPYYSEVGRPSIDPELMIRMLIVGYSFGIRSERRLCDEVHLNLAYRGGSVAWGSTATSRIIRRFPRTATAVFATTICFASSSRRWWPAHEGRDRGRPTDLYVCPGGKELRKRRRLFSSLRSDVTKDGTIVYRASKLDCDTCALKSQCCPNMPARKIARSVHEAARDKARNRQDRSLRCLTPRTEESRDALRSPETNPEARPATPSRAKRSQR